MRQRRRVLLIVTIVLGAALLRGSIALTVRPDWDEDDYLAAAATMRRHIEAGEWAALPHVAVNSEHPPLPKLAYAAILNPAELDDFYYEIPRFTRWPQPPDSTQNARLLAVTLGTLTVLLVALVSPLAGALLAVQSIHLHYTSVIYLEPLPALLSAAAVILYTRRQRQAFWLAAVMFGAAVAGKYMYGVAGVAIVLHALFIARDRPLARRFVRVTAWGVVAIVVFFALNPYLWSDPIGRLSGQLSYFSDYASWYTDRHTYTRPFTEMIAPEIHLAELLTTPPLAALRLTDTLIGLAAIPGVIVLLRRRTTAVYGLWLVLGFAFMMMWTAQWPQHRMTIIVPYTVAAAAGLAAGGLWLRARFSRRTAGPTVLPDAG